MAEDGGAGATALTAGQGIGKPVLRREDLRLLTGRGRFSDDMTLPGQAHAYMVRSPHAHANIRSVDVREARESSGVVAVYTAIEAEADSLKPLPVDYSKIVNVVGEPSHDGGPEPPLYNHPRTERFESPYELLARDRVRFAGQLVAMIVAESVAAAKDAAEKVAVDYEVLPAVTDTRAAAGAEAPRIWPYAPSNLVIDGELGDRAATEAAFAKAAHVVRLETTIQRLTGVPLELRSVLAAYDAASDRYHVHAGCGSVVRQREEIAHILGVPKERVRMLAYEIGGNFGTRNQIYPEFALAAWAARKCGRPVKWTAERTEAFLSDYQGRDLVSEAELALDAEGNFLALRCDNLSNLGAFASSSTPLRKGLSIMSGVYRIPAGVAAGRGVLSNTPGTIPYRSAGRPEAMFIVERLIDKAAQLHGFDRIALRRRNLVRPDEMPYTNFVGVTYDNGAYEAVMEKAMQLGDWDGFPARRAEAKARGILRGIGIANYIEITLGYPRECAEITVKPGPRRIEVVVGTQSTGQGHETSFCQCVAEWLGVPLESVDLVQGDTDRVSIGGGSHSGRSMRMAGYVMGEASGEVIARGRRIAAHMLEAAVDEISFADGVFTANGTNRSAHLFEVAAAAEQDQTLAEDLRGPIMGVHQRHFREAGFPYGCHVCEVEIDPDTGALDLVRYAAVDDVGRAINPLILHGQAHGGIAQGVGQALWERTHFDPASGQPLTASFMDYAMPRADRLPKFETEVSEVPSPSNPLGVRAGGEGGTTPALAVVVNAAVDALKDYGVTHLDMPLTSERIWCAMQRG
ncbi:MAG: hypothetical protein RLZ98_1363 [Pseudomonadota bacterium]|jgi:carbon-monoxide dehydrogenase large subunit